MWYKLFFKNVLKILNSLKALNFEKFKIQINYSEYTLFAEIFREHRHLYFHTQTDFMFGK